MKRTLKRESKVLEVVKREWKAGREVRGVRTEGGEGGVWVEIAGLISCPAYACLPNWYSHFS